ncbi:SapC family protein [Alteromonas sp. ASW11-130]|uniref:SapC family protein n=1 Tax=Alteromonas sp. ASW11-130 TaxID=3015775 RepID=UPI0022429F4D|nr:SapC family protein [Alteromonas sp. ASW11-130]MCW8091637.1 SapC family protein [Alteromonas sp. ASW11-130]
MAANYIPLDKDKHKNIKIASKHSFEFAQNTHLAAATIKEFARLASAMPIVFIKDPSTNRHHIVAMLGVEQGQNLFIKDGQWQASHVPMNIVRYPFDVRPDGDKLGIFIDENSPLFTEDGLPLFTENGEATDVLKDRQQFLADLANSELTTQRFVTQVVEADLLEPIRIHVAYDDGSKRNVTGMMNINEKKLLELDDAKVLELHKAGFMGAIYALMMSMGQLNRLIELSKNTDKAIANMQVGADTEQSKAPEKASQ